MIYLFKMSKTARWFRGLGLRMLREEIGAIKGLHRDVGRLTVVRGNEDVRVDVFQQCCLHAALGLRLALGFSLWDSSVDHVIEICSEQCRSAAELYACGFPSHPAILPHPQGSALIWFF